jgi:hypothetical protein
MQTVEDLVEVVVVEEDMMPWLVNVSKLNLVLIKGTVAALKR